jgi:hypothetical protein
MRRTFCVGFARIGLAVIKDRSDSAALKRAAGGSCVDRRWFTRNPIGSSSTGHHMDISGSTKKLEAVEAIDEKRKAEAIAVVQSMLRPSHARMQEIYNDWIEKEFWTIIEAATIGIGLDPDLLDVIQYMLPEDARTFHKLRRLLERRFVTGAVKPAEFAEWAQERKTIKALIAKPLLFEIQKTFTKQSRPGDESRKQGTLEKIVLTMAAGKYGFGKRTISAVADLIKMDFENLSSGTTLSKGAITTALTNANNEHDQLRDAIEQRSDSKETTGNSK